MHSCIVQYQLKGTHQKNNEYMKQQFKTICKLKTLHVARSPDFCGNKHLQRPTVQLVEKKARSFLVQQLNLHSRNSSHWAMENHNMKTTFRV